MRTTINLDDDVYESVVALSKSSGKPMGKVMSDLLRKKMQAKSYKKVEGFPIIPLKEGSPIIPGYRAYEILDEEGY